jgi:hypothetical protein
MDESIIFSMNTCISLHERAFFKRLIDETGWKNTVLDFKRRIVKLYKENNSLSVREWKLLRRTVKKQKLHGQIDVQQILFLFPGKNESYIRE